jgi:hypothetical protein
MESKVFYWLPRVLTIAAIFFMLMFSFDVFQGNDPFSRKIIGFFMHNIPVMILTIILLIAWRWEMTGGLLFIAAFFVAAIYLKSFTSNTGSLVVILPFLLCGVLFVLHDILYKSKPKPDHKS